MKILLKCLSLHNSVLNRSVFLHIKMSTLKPFLVFVHCGFLVQALVASEIYENDPSECTLTGNSLDNFTSIISNCREILIKDFEVPAGVNLDLNLKDGTAITFAGRITFGYEEWDGYFITIKGNGLNITGARGNLLDGEGARWWDGLGGNSGKKKPKFLKLNTVTNTIVKGISIKNAPKHIFSITNSVNVIVSDITIDNLDGDTRGGHNTDAFGVSESDGVTINNSIVFNQDDCLAVTSGSNIIFHNNYCSGGHGISIGSIGNHKSNEVDNLHVYECKVADSANGIRIKTAYNTTGVVTNVIFENITFENITNYGIIIEGDYLNGGSSGVPSPGFIISNLTLRNIHGWTQPTATNVKVLLSEGVASNWTVDDVVVEGGSTDETVCTGIPDDAGFSCSDYTQSITS